MAAAIEETKRKPMTVKVDADKYIALLKDAERYRWLKDQAQAGDWGHHYGWKLHLDIKGALSLESFDEALDAIRGALIDNSP
jgi:hypothetical protein